MKEFMNPELEVTKFVTEDVITTSFGGNANEGTESGGCGEDY